MYYGPFKPLDSDNMDILTFGFKILLLIILCFVFFSAGYGFALVKVNKSQDAVIEEYKTRAAKVGLEFNKLEKEKRDCEMRLNSCIGK